MRSYRDFSKPFSVEIIANKKAVELKRKGCEWDEIRQLLNISLEELRIIQANYMQLLENDLKKLEQ